MLGSTQNRYCEDCGISFQVYEVKARRKYFCPCCGDSVCVFKYRAKRSGARVNGKVIKIAWHDSELLMLQDIINGKATVYEVAIKLGRPSNAVSKRLGRYRKELELLGNKK